MSRNKSNNAATRQNEDTASLARVEPPPPKEIKPERHSGQASNTPDYTIDPEFAALIPPAMPEEEAQLEASIQAEGCRDPLVVWKGHGLLLDGHTRHVICEKLGKTPSIVEKELPDRQAAIDWIVCNQLSRRNLAPHQTSYLRGCRYNTLKQSHGGPRGQGASAQSEHLKTADQLAAKYAISAATIRRDGVFSRAIDRIVNVCGQDSKSELLSGRRGWTQVEIIELAKKDPAEIKKTYQEWLETGHKPRTARTLAKNSTRNQQSMAHDDRAEGPMVNETAGAGIALEDSPALLDSLTQDNKDKQDDVLLNLLPVGSENTDGEAPVEGDTEAAQPVILAGNEDTASLLDGVYMLPKEPKAFVTELLDQADLEFAERVREELTRELNTRKTAEAVSR